MRKTVLATITVGALALTACTSESDTESTAPENAGNNVVLGPIGDQSEASQQLDELLLSSQGVSSWDEATEGWARDVIGTDVNGIVLLVHTTFDVDNGDRVEDAERIGEEVVRIVSDDPASDQVGRVTVTYYDGRGAYTEQL